MVALLGCSILQVTTDCQPVLGIVCHAYLTEIQDVVGLDEVFGPGEGKLSLRFSLQLEREGPQHEEDANGLQVEDRWGRKMRYFIHKN